MPTLTITNTLDATTTSASLLVQGGVSIQKSIYVAGNVNVNNSLLVANTTNE